jgi:hypothetical protein
MSEWVIYIEREVLTDNSVVFNVRMGECLFPARDEDAASDLAEAMAAAINKNTTTDAEVHYG